MSRLTFWAHYFSEWRGLPELRKLPGMFAMTTRATMEVHPVVSKASTHVRSGPWLRCCIITLYHTPFFPTGFEPFARVTVYLTDESTLSAFLGRSFVAHRSIVDSYRK